MRAVISLSVRRPRWNRRRRGHDASRSALGSGFRVAASSSASVRAESIPAWASARAVPLDGLAEARWRSLLLQPGLFVGGGERIQDGVEVTVEHLVEVVRS